MSRQTQNTRNLLYNTGYYLIIDFCNQMDADLITSINEAVSETLALACSSRGVSRIPYFGLAVLNSHFDIKWKLSRLKGNFIKINKAFNLLKKISDSAMLKEEEFLDCLHMGIKQILSHIDDLSRSPCDDITDLKSNMKIVLLTKKDGFVIKYFLASLMDQLDRQKLCEIQIIELNENIRFNIVKDDILQLIQMTSCSNNLERLFKGWLMDLRFDREDLILKICNHEIKCDIHEILLNTSLIPFGNSFHIHKEITNSSSSHLPDPVMPVYILEILERICSSGISESSVFGYPIQIRATQACKQDSQIQNFNTQRFNALCKMLFDTDEYLIARLLSSGSPLTAHFVLMPGDNMFLVKSLASRELMFPSTNSLDCNNNSEDLDYEIRLEMSNFVFSLPLSDEYDPIKYKSNINSSLLRQLQAHLPKQSSLSAELNDLQTKSKLFAQRNFKRMSSSREKISTNKKQKIDHSNDLKLLNHYGSLG